MTEELETLRQAILHVDEADMPKEPERICAYCGNPAGENWVTVEDAHQEIMCAFCQAAAPKARLQILNWREHSDDESYVRTGVYPPGSLQTVQGELHAEMLADEQPGGVFVNEYEDDGEGGVHLVGYKDISYYVNNNITFEDGQIIEHAGKKFRISITEVKEGDVNGPGN
jgi:hypothetical protein